MTTSDTPADCTPWVLGGLWPAELSSRTLETATIADCLENDLRRIAGVANQRICGLQRTHLPDDVRRAETARIIDMARALAVQSVESTVRQVNRPPEPPAPRPPTPRVEAAECDDERLTRLLRFVARQEPGLRWAVADRADGRRYGKPRTPLIAIASARL